MDTPFFFNISNHPSAKWPAPQWTAARALGMEIIDIPFPDVDPSLDDLSELVEKVAAQVLAICPSGWCRGMIAGEPVLTALLVARLQPGMECFSATTRRLTVEKDGVKTSVFQFDHFRPWPRLVIGGGK